MPDFEHKSKDQILFSPAEVQDPEQRARLEAWVDRLGLRERFLLKEEPPVQKSSPPELESHWYAHLSAGLEWEDLKDEALALYEAQPKPARAAELLADIHGQSTSRNLYLAAQSLGMMEPQLWVYLPHNLRGPILLRLWRAKAHSILKELISRCPEDAWLPLEALYFYWEIRLKTEPLNALKDYSKCEAALETALGEFNQDPLIKPGFFYYTLGKMALEFELLNLARYLLEKIPAKDEEYAKALDLGLRAPWARNDDLSARIEKTLELESSWEKRLSILSEYLGEVRRLGHAQGAMRPALNQLLRQIAFWFPKEPRAWEALSQTLVAHWELGELLPSLPLLWLNEALNYHSRELDRALWSPLSQLELLYPKEPGSAAARLLSLSYLHEFVWAGDEASEYLWRALKWRFAWQDSPKSSALSWRDIHQRALAFVAQNTAYTDTQRAKKLRILRVACAPEELRFEDLSQFFMEETGAPRALLQNLTDHLRLNGNPALEYLGLTKSFYSRSATNEELSRLWLVANQLEDHDAAWRVATVLKAREALCEQATHAWSISGEKRLEYPLWGLSAREFQTSMDGINSQWQPFLTAFLVLGPKLKLFLAPEKKTPFKRSTEAPLAPEQKQLGLKLAQIFHLKKYEPQLLQGFVPHTEDCVPFYSPHLSHTTFGFVLVQVAEILGCYTIKFDFSELKKSINLSLPPSLFKSSWLRAMPELGHWLRTLTNEEKLAWDVLKRGLEELPLKDLNELLKVVVLRLTLSIYQGHFQALTSLKDNLSPLWFIRQAEAWILSPTYGELRKSLHSFNRIPVPLGLRKAPIHEIKWT